MPYKNSFNFRFVSPFSFSERRLWESKHLNPVWDFEHELGRKVRSLLSLMDHPINMAHMAKLFTSQLILSCNFNVSAFVLHSSILRLSLVRHSFCVCVPLDFLGRITGPTECRSIKIEQIESATGGTESF